MHRLGLGISLILTFSWLQFIVPCLGQAMKQPCVENSDASCESATCCQPKASPCFGCCNAEPSCSTNDSIMEVQEKNSQACTNLPTPHSLFKTNLCLVTLIQTIEDSDNFNSHLTNNHRFQLSAAFLI